MSQKPIRQFLKDYQAPHFQIFKTHLKFEIEDHSTKVINEMELHRTSEGPLLLNGPQLSFVSLLLKTKEGKETPLREGLDFILQEGLLTFETPLQDFSLVVVTTLKPKENTALEGLYQTGSGLCTQCEPESFRAITFFMDRPDVMSKFTTTIVADQTQFPILLSNGNRTAHQVLEGGRHLVTWEDPFLKPCYLFALVAGDYDVLKDSYTTKSGRLVSLEIYCQRGYTPKCQHAMEALKRSMKWDEDTYDREYDLDQYLILAVDDFNGGAMENKGLNIFNSQLIFADSKTSTDLNYERVESVIAHEYFHNWTGNRITLRDWFQLSLKEGLTVFREQHYMMDINSHSLKRIDDVQFLRNKQFPEDAGPNAHPVRPESCYSVDNFFTTTVYEKGAEVIRVLKEWLGEDLFFKGMAHYFKTFDGKAITIEDFLSCFETVSGKDFSTFKRWYSQAGTPRIRVRDSFDATQKMYSITLEQSCPPTPDQGEKAPFLIPVKTSFYSRTSKKALADTDGKTEFVLELDQPSKTWTFPCNESQKPVLSPLRGFSAPVIADWQPEREDLEFLALNDSDGFNRWDAIQKISLQELTQLYSQLVSPLTPHSNEPSKASSSPLTTHKINKYYVTLFGGLIERALENPELTARLIELPSASSLLQELPLNLDPAALSDSYKILETELAQSFNKQLWSLYEALSLKIRPEDYSFKAMGLRGLQSQTLRYLGRLESNLPSLFELYKKAETMNQQAGLMNALNLMKSPERQEALKLFEDQWKNDSLTMNKWIQWQAQFDHEEVYLQLEKIFKGPHFRATNPNHVRNLLGVFIGASWKGFHREDGLGYEFLKNKLLHIDGLNPQTAARIAQGLENWYRFEPKRKAGLQKCMTEILAHPKLSKNCFEIIKRSIEFEAPQPTQN